MLTTVTGRHENIVQVTLGEMNRTKFKREGMDWNTYKLCLGGLDTGTDETVESLWEGQLYRFRNKLADKEGERLSCFVTMCDLLLLSK